MATDLPEPVVPATSRCGMRARSAITGSPPMVLPRQSGSFCCEALKSRVVQLLAQVHGVADLVGQLDADGVAAGNNRHAGRDRAHGAGDVVGQSDHPRGFGAGRGLEFVEGHDGPGLDVDDLALDAEIPNDFFKMAGGFLEDVFRQNRSFGLRRLAEIGEIGQFVARVDFSGTEVGTTGLDASTAPAGKPATGPPLPAPSIRSQASVASGSSMTGSMMG